jgi:phage-related protein
MANYNLGTVQGEIRIDYDGKGVKEAQADVKAAAKQLEREKLQLKLGADRKQLTADIAAATADLAKWAAMEPTAEVNIEIEKARTRLIALEAQAAKLDNQRIVLQVEIDNGRLDAAANKMLATFAGARKRISEFGGDVRNTRDAVEGLGNTMSAASKIVFLAGAATQLGTLVAALAPATGALLVVPAAGLAIAAAFGVVKMATAGMGDAFSAVAEGDAKKLNEAMAKLSPEAQEVVRQYAAMKPQLDGLKLGVQNKFWEGQAEILGQLGATYLPMMQTQLTSLAGTMGSMVQQSAKALMAPETVTALNAVLTGTNDLFRELGSAPGDFLAGLIQVGSVGAQYLGLAGEKAGSLAMQFRNWTASAEGQQQINEWIRQGWTVLTQLYNILVNVGKIAMGLFQPLAADGQSLLQTLVALTAQAAAWVASAEGQQTIANIWSMLSVVGGALLTVISTIAPIIQALASWFASLPAPVQSVIGSFIAWSTVIGLILAKTAPLIAFFIQIAPLIARLGPLLTGLATAFRVVMTVFRALTMLMMTNPWILLIAAVIALVAIIIANWDTIWAYLQGIWASITAAWNTFVSFLTSTGSSVWQTISAAWTAAISAISSFFSGVWAGVTAVWTSFIATLMAAGSNVWTVISGIWTAVIGGIVAYFSTVWTVVSTIWSALISTILAIGSAVWETIKTIWFAAILTIWALLTGKFDLLGQIWTTLIEKIKAIGSNLWNTISGIWSGAISTIVSTVTNFVSNVVSAISNFVSRAVSFFTNLGSQIVSSVSNWVSNVISRVSSFASSVGAAISNFASQAVARISQFVSQAISFFSNLASQGPSRISAMVSSIISYVGNLASQFVARVSAMAGQVVARMSALAGQIVSAIASLPGRMVALGSSIIQGIISGISGAAGRLFSYLGGLATQALNAAKAAFGINSPSKLFRDAIGASIPEGVEVGVDANVGGMLASVSSLAEQAQKAALDALSRPELARVGALVGANAAGASGTMLGASTASAIAPPSPSGAMQIGNLTVNVKGIVDPNDPVAWRRFGEEVRELIMDVEDSYK